MNTQIKICGLTSMEDVKIINKWKPDFIGCVLYYPKSKRNVSPDLAKQIIEGLEDNIKKVAVVVSPTSQQVNDIGALGFDYIQIHGECSEEMISNSALPVIRAMNIKNELSDVQNEKLNDIKKKQVDESFYLNLNNIVKLDKIYGVLFDSGTPGSGETFSWNVIHKAQKIVTAKNKKVFLAGGLNPENVTQAIHAIAPDIVDVSSGVEYENQPSRTGKDEKRVEDFIKVVRMED